MIFPADSQASNDTKPYGGKVFLESFRPNYGRGETAKHSWHIPTKAHSWLRKEKMEKFTVDTTMVWW